LQSYRLFPGRVKIAPMKKTDSKSTSSPVPRLNSLLHRLQKAPGQKDESYLDQLMIFLDNPPAKGVNRWQKGAEMCAAWDVSTSDTAVCRLFRSYALEWRSRIAIEASLGDAEKKEVEEKATKMLALRIYEILSDPEASPDSLVNLALLDVRRQALELARQKYADSRTTQIELALRHLETQVFGNREAQFAFDRLNEALARKNKELARKTKIASSPLLLAANPDMAFKIVSQSLSADSPFSPYPPDPPDPLGSPAS
jgi:hypothetical protein